MEERTRLHIAIYSNIALALILLVVMVTLILPQQVFNSEMHSRVYRMNQTVTSLAALLPLQTASYNDFIEAQFTADPEFMNVSRGFNEAMRDMTSSGKLERFFNCTPPYQNYVINYLVYENFSLSEKTPRVAVGFETAFFDAANGKRMESIYVTRNFVIFEKIGCARIVYTPDGRFDVEYAQFELSDVLVNVTGGTYV